MEGGSTYYPEWAMALDMAHGDPLRAKEIFETLDAEWFGYWAVWMSERRKAKIPDWVVGIITK